MTKSTYYFNILLSNIFFLKGMNKYIVITCHKGFVLKEFSREYNWQQIPTFIKMYHLQ